jgi:hypothetical protein
MATFNGTTPYTVTGSTANVTGSTAYTVTDSSSLYPFQKRVGSTLLPIQFGRRRGTVIDWLSPDLPSA